ncbi:MAG: hypothetical protein VKL41_02245 [Snowella sp.]|nr:hypothetical protein [Snowella sp.]
MLRQNRDRNVAHCFNVQATHRQKECHFVCSLPVESISRSLSQPLLKSDHN